MVKSKIINDIGVFVREHPAISTMDGLPAGIGSLRGIPQPERVTRRRWPKSTPQCAIAILCRDKGPYLAEAIESALDQDYPAREIIVVDGSSTDDTAEVADRFAKEGPGVRYLWIDARNPHAMRRAALEATAARSYLDALVWLDAGDVLPPDYLAEGIGLFVDRTVGIVYSDVQDFAESDELHTVPELRQTLCESDLHRRNHVHAGAIVLRQALEISAALDWPISDDATEDQAAWQIWRRVVEGGFTARKSPVAYRRRVHGQIPAAPLPFYERATLTHETVTVFVQIAGAEDWESRVRAWLDAQAWPREQVRLVLVDTSADGSATAGIREWFVAAAATYDVRRYRFPVETELDAARLFIRARRETRSEYLLLVDPAEKPPVDGIEQLLRQMDERTGYVCWGVQAGLFDDGEEAAPLATWAWGVLYRRSWLRHNALASVTDAATVEPAEAAHRAERCTTSYPEAL